MSTVQPLTCPTFMDSETHLNLQAAIAQEESARRLYLHASARMEEASLHVVAHVFRFTAAQTKEHADILRGLLAAGGGCAVLPEADEPHLPREPLELLRAAAQAAHETWDAVFPRYARTAMEEGYPRLATALHRIAETKQLHARRFAQYMEALSSGSLFRDDRRVSWFCLACGQLHSGFEAPAHCSGCGRDQGHFIRSSHYPFCIEG